MSVPLYRAKAEFFRMLGHPVRTRVLELPQDGPSPGRGLLAAIELLTGRNELLAELRDAEVVTR